MLAVGESRSSVITYQAHPMLSKCNCPLLVQVNSNPVDIMITIVKLVHSSHRLIYHLSEPQGATLCIPRPRSLGNRYSEHKLVGSYSIRLLSYSSQGDPKDTPVQLSHETYPTFLKQSNNEVFHYNPQHLNHLVSRGPQLQEQGFSMDVAERIVAPQRSSPRTSTD